MAESSRIRSTLGDDVSEAYTARRARHASSRRSSISQDELSTSYESTRVPSYSALVQQPHSVSVFSIDLFSNMSYLLIRSRQFITFLVPSPLSSFFFECYSPNVLLATDFSVSIPTEFGGEFGVLAFDEIHHLLLRTVLFAKSK